MTVFGVGRLPKRINAGMACSNIDSNFMIDGKGTATAAAAAAVDPTTASHAARTTTTSPVVQKKPPPSPARAEAKQADDYGQPSPAYKDDGSVGSGGGGGSRFQQENRGGGMANGDHDHRGPPPTR